MTKLIFSLFVLFASLNSFGQIQDSKSEVASSDMVQKCHETAVYKLFPTENMWTFIKLNTRNGKMWQVQFDVSGDNRFETFLNILPLATGTKEENGRFTLYPTENMYSFILLDQIDGRVWQAQWSMEPENRGIIPIE
jgi:hypothetical protein